LRQRGFSLIELLIVVAIILVISAIAIPNLMRSRMSANEASAMASVRAVTTAQVAYITAYPTIGFADNLTKLAAPVGGGPVTSNNAGLLDWVLGCATQPCRKSGYNFQITNAVGAPISTYVVTGVPVIPGSTGVRGFCSGHQMVIMFDPNGGISCTLPVQ
jgi:type IV pilus assembly protein PilA